MRNLDGCKLYSSKKTPDLQTSYKTVFGILDFSKPFPSSHLTVFRREHMFEFLLQVCERKKIIPYRVKSA